MKNKLPEIEQVYQEFNNRLQKGESFSVLKQEYLSKMGIIPTLMRSIGQRDEELRPQFAQATQELKRYIEDQLRPQQEHHTKVTADMTVPPLPNHFGSIHPISAMIEEMCTIFSDLAFETVTGSEIVSDTENFEYLNITEDHPARDSHDSFYINEHLLLRTQTTAVQVLEMRKRFSNNRLPIRVVVPGKTYRRESDQTHTALFHQIDAVMVDTQTTFSDLRGTLDYFCKRLFGEQVETRFRPHYFPFTEPSAELDIRWKGTSEIAGKHTQWLEMGGCGMIHPEVLKRADINPKVYQGWAFGMSIERPLMVRHHIPDIRLLYANGVSTLEQFSYIV